MSHCHLDHARGTLDVVVMPKVTALTAQPTAHPRDAQHAGQAPSSSPATGAARGLAADAPRALTR